MIIIMQLLISADDRDLRLEGIDDACFEIHQDNLAADPIPV